MEQFLLEWPDVAQHNLQLSGNKLASLSHAIWALRSGQLNHENVQSYLLSAKFQDENALVDKLIVLCALHFARININAFESVLVELRSIAPDRSEVRSFTLVLWLWKNDIASLSKAPSGIWDGAENSCLLRICKAYYLLKIGRASDALQLVESEQNPPLELFLLRAKILAFTSASRSSNSIEID